MFYYKQIDILGNIIALLTCDTHLGSSESQIEITEEEYNTLLQTMQSEDEEAFEDVIESEDVESIE